MYRMIKYKVFWKEIYECSVFMQNVFDVFFDQKQIENNFLLKIINEIKLEFSHTTKR